MPAIPMRMPGLARNVASAIKLRGNTRWRTALTVVSTRNGWPDNFCKRASAAKRRANISADGETRS